jgi:hypothetical protein
MTTTHFASEAVPNNPGPALAVVIGAKNVVSFAASFGVVPMVHKYKLFGVFGSVLLLGIPIYLLNPVWRTYVGKRDRA